MRILLITFSDNADHQDITFGMYESLIEANLPDVDVWVMGIKEPRVPLMKTKHTKMVDCPKRPGIEWKTFDVFTLFSIVRWVKSQCFDVILFETLHVWNLPLMILKNNNTKIFQMIHDLIPHQGDKQAKSVDLMNKVVCKLSDYIVLANKKYVDKATEIYGIEPQKVLSIDMWRRFPKYTEPRNTKQVLFFGRINPYKGVENLLEIVKLCPDIKFNVVGRVDPQVQGLVNELKDFSNVTMNNGYVSDDEMTEAFINADWVILPYNSATQSGVIIDGYRFGRPSIAFNVGAISEQIDDGVSGYLVEPGNNKAFAEKIREAVQMSDEAYKELSQSAYYFGVNKYAATGAIDRFIKAIKG